MFQEMFDVKNELCKLAESIGVKCACRIDEVKKVINLYVSDFKFAGIYKDRLSTDTMHIVDVDCFIEDDRHCCYPLIWYATRKDEDPGDCIKQTITEQLTKYISTHKNIGESVKCLKRMLNK